jgi:hypothetical protein
MPRSKPTKPTRKMRQAALAALHSVVRDDSVPPYVKAKAAASLLGADRPDAADVLMERDPDAPRRYVVLPAKDGDPNVRYGLYSEDQMVVLVPHGWPMEIQPEAHYAGVPRPAPDPRFAARMRAKMLPAPELIEGDDE